MLSNIDHKVMKSLFNPYTIGKSVGGRQHFFNFLILKPSFLQLKNSWLHSLLNIINDWSLNSYQSTLQQPVRSYDKVKGWNINQESVNYL